MCNGSQALTPEKNISSLNGQSSYTNIVGKNTVRYGEYKLNSKKYYVTSIGDY